MHYRTIAERAIDASLIGEGERFVAYGRGLYDLARQRVPSELEEAV